MIEWLANLDERGRRTLGLVVTAIVAVAAVLLLTLDGGSSNARATPSPETSNGTPIDPGQVIDPDTPATKPAAPSRPDARVPAITAQFPMSQAELDLGLQNAMRALVGISSLRQGQTTSEYLATFEPYVTSSVLDLYRKSMSDASAGNGSGLVGAVTAKITHAAVSAITPGKVVFALEMVTTSTPSKTAKAQSHTGAWSVTVTRGSDWKVTDVRYGAGRSGAE